MHHNPKPVRKCHGCPLNLGDRCGVFPDPHRQWHAGGKCKGYGNEELRQQYLDNLAKHPPDEKKEKRREEAKFERTNHPPSFMPGFRVPKR